MTFQQLQYLMEVWRTGSISGAAKKLFCSQSSVSASIINLEEELGFPIFIRSRKGVIPTIQGSAVIEHAARIFESYRALTENNFRCKRQIRIGAPSIELLDVAFVELIAHYANNNTVSFTAGTYHTQASVQKLLSFELDIAVLMNHTGRLLSVENMLKTNELEWQIIGTLPAVCQIGPSHPLYEKESVEISDLQNYLFVDNIHDPLLYNEYLKGFILLSPEKTITVNSTHARNMLVAKGLGYSIGTGAPKAVASALSLRSIPLKNVVYTLSVVTNPKQPISQEVETYIRLIKAAYKNFSLR